MAPRSARAIEVSAKTKIGVIGTGYLGRFHAMIYARMPEVELVGVADTDLAKARAVAAELACPAFADSRALLGRVDAVSVVVPTTAHLEVARPFLEHRVHMLMEKPIAPSLEEGRAIVALAERAGVILQVGHLERFNGGVMALADLIERPRFIEAHRMGGFVERATDVDVVSDLMIHDIDIILSLVDAEITRIAAVGSPVLTDHVDIANARLEFANGTVANVVASRVSDTKMRRIRVFQERRYLALDFIEQYIDVAYTRARPGGGRREIVRERIEVAPVKPLDKELEAFVHCVRTGMAPLVNGHVGLEALQVALQVKAKMLADTAR